MEHVTTLDRLAVGQAATVSASPGDRRLLELGFVPGAAVEAVLESPWGDPAAYFVCGAVIALRRADARRIPVRRAEKEPV